MPRFLVTITEMREVETEMELNAANVEEAKKKAESWESYNQAREIHIHAEDMVTNHSREVKSVEEIKSGCQATAEEATF